MTKSRNAGMWGFFKVQYFVFKYCLMTVLWLRSLMGILMFMNLVIWKTLHRGDDIVTHLQLGMGVCKIQTR